MAAARHNLTRRALLGVSVVAPVALAAPAAEPAAGSAGMAARWTRALTAYRSAAAALGAFRRSRLGPAAEAHSRARARWALDHDCRGDPEARALLVPLFAAVRAAEEAAGDLECARLAALRRLLRTPAPDLPALALKIALIVDNEAWDLTGAEPCLAALKTDARRLLACGRPVTGPEQ